MSLRHVGSRGSDLALWQSNTVLGVLSGMAESGPAGAQRWDPEVTVITTRGDVDQSAYLAGGVEKGFFTKELEIALLDRRIDLVVHSLKDLPTAGVPGLLNRTVLPRATAADWLLIRREFHVPRDDGRLPLADGARVGASSLRRGALLGCYAPQARAVPLRGNVPTRVAKLAAGQQVDAIVLAAAGLSRLALDLSAFVVIELDPKSWVPAPGQGALAAQCRSEDGDVAAQIAAISHAECQSATHWEREFLRVIEGGCSTPFGCYIAGHRAHLGMATERGWAARSIELPDNLSEESQRESFIRAAVDGCKPVELATATGAVGRTLFAR